MSFILAIAQTSSASWDPCCVCLLLQVIYCLVSCSLVAVMSLSGHSLLNLVFLVLSQYSICLDLVSCWGNFPVPETYKQDRLERSPFSCLSNNVLFFSWICTGPTLMITPLHRSKLFVAQGYIFVAHCQILWKHSPELRKVWPVKRYCHICRCSVAS